MINIVNGLFLLISFSAIDQPLDLNKYIDIKVREYERNGETRISVQPEILGGTLITKFERRFLYILLNIPKIHQPEQKERINQIKSYYPDTFLIAESFIREYNGDSTLQYYFNQTLEPILTPQKKEKVVFSSDELLEVASKFFYCDKVKSDTSIQAHVCVGLNGVKEANWEEDYTLLQAFCFEAIFFGIMNNESSKIWDTFSFAKQQSSEFYRPNLTTLDKYLENVKLDLFERMKTNTILKSELLAYYEETKDTLAFRIEK